MNYLEAEKILRKNLSPIPRTYSEAVKDADDATAIWRCETEWDRTKELVTWCNCRKRFTKFVC